MCYNKYIRYFIVRELRKVAKKISKKIKKIIINVNEIQLNQRKFTTSEIGRGIGIQDTNKGRRSYKRRKKHKKKDSEE